MAEFEKHMEAAAESYNTAVEYYFHSNASPEAELKLSDYYITPQMLKDTFMITGRVATVARDIVASLSPEDREFMGDILRQFK